MYFFIFVFVCGIWFGYMKISILIPMIINIFICFESWVIISIIFLLGFLYFKFFLIFSFGFQTTSGRISYISEKNIYIEEQNHIKKISINNRNIKGQKIGDVIRFSYMNYGNQYKLLKIYKTINNKNDFIDQQRAKIAAFLHQSQYSYLLKAIVIGDKDSIPKQTQEKLKQNNFWHLVAISGLHLNIIMFSSYWFFRKIFSLSFKLNYKWHNGPKILAVTTGFIYIAISFFAISAMRAFILSSINVLVPEKYDSRKITILTAFLFLFFSPKIIMDIGFQLSFLFTIFLLEKKSIYYINLYLLPILKTITPMILFNFLVIPIFTMILYLTFISIILNSTILLKITDFFCFCFFRISLISSPYATISFNSVECFIYILMSNVSFFLNKDYILYVSAVIMFFLLKFNY